MTYEAATVYQDERIVFTMTNPSSESVLQETVVYGDCENIKYMNPYTSQAWVHTFEELKAML